MGSKQKVRSGGQRPSPRAYRGLVWQPSSPSPASTQPTARPPTEPPSAAKWPCRCADTTATGRDGRQSRPSKKPTMKRPTVTAAGFLFGTKYPAGLALTTPSSTMTSAFQMDYATVPEDTNWSWLDTELQGQRLHSITQPNSASPYCHPTGNWTIMPTPVWPTGADHQCAVITPKMVERTLEEVYSPQVATMCAKLERALRYFTVAGIRGWYSL